ncbi:site-2 protease family protein [Pyrofollis japonicus]|uniref:site-2 protease family protein n=1 Tax=Pyrofollis japonicus TaxID=3060460 RepID=UPI00295BF4E3|nr:site-2 protease family protein [Pyrofollis japonicus]BEP17037.1 site-2 protease family protein [Pyrofollis japonicus]
MAGTTLQALAAYVAAWILLGILLSSKRSEKFEASPFAIVIRLRKRFEYFDKLRGNRLVGLLLDVGIASMFILMALFYAMIIKRVLLIISGKPAGEAPIVPLIPGVSIDITTFLYILPGLSLAVIVHEIMHALASRHGGVEVKNAGILVFLGLIPAAFVEPDEDKLRKSSLRTRLRVYSAGVLANVLLWLFLLLLLKPITAQGFYMHIIKVEANSFAQEYGVQPGLTIKEVYINTTGPLDFTSFQKVMNKIRYENGGTLANITLIVKFVLLNDTTITVVKKAAPSNTSREEKKKYEMIGIYFVPVPKTLIKLGFSPSTAYTVFTILWLTELINIGLAGINAAPIFITDGARVVNDVAAALLRDERKGAMINNIVSLVTLILIIPNINI